MKSLIYNIITIFKLKRLIWFLVGLMFIWGGNSLVAQDWCENNSVIIDVAQILRSNKQCSPVTVTYTLTYYKVQNYIGKNLFVYVDWDNGDEDREEAIFVEDTSNPDDNSWTYTFTYNYNSDGNRCSYKVKSYLEINGERCESTLQEGAVIVWDRDDSNGGEPAIEPQIHYVCYGEPATVIFTDNSKWNCDCDLTEHWNRRGRWTQWIYGTTYLPGPSYQQGDPDYPIMDATTMIWDDPGGIMVGSIPYEGIDIEDVVVSTIDPLACPFNTPPGPGITPQPPNNTSMEIHIPAWYPPGSRFEVTLFNWNQCNPWPAYEDDPTIAKAWIEVVPRVYAKIIEPDSVCVNGNGVTITLEPGSTLGGTWSCSVVGAINPNTGVFNPGIAGPGIHTITYTVGTHCPGTYTTEIKVLKAPKFDLNEKEPLHLCPDIMTTIEIEDIECETEDYTIVWSWTSIPPGLPEVLYGTEDLFRVFEAKEVGEYTVTITLTDDNGCSFTKDLLFVVAYITVTFAPDIKVCQGMPLIMNPIISGGNQNYEYHEWTLIDPPGLDITTILSATNIKNPIFQYDTPGSYTFNYKVIDTSGCEEEEQVTIQVIPQPVAVAEPYFEICEPLVTMEAEPWGEASGSWSVISCPAGVTVNFSPDNTFPNATVTFTPAYIYGTYKLEWRLTLDICYDADTVEIHYVSKPTPSVISDFEICGAVAEIKAIISTGNGEWSCNFPSEVDIDDIYSATTNVTVIEPFTTPRTYAFTWTETLMGENQEHCSGSATVNVTFNPQAEAVIAPVDPACSPYRVDFQNLSTNAETYNWVLLPGITSDDENPSFIYYTLNTVEQYTITLNAYNSYNCNHSITTDIFVMPKPEPAIIADPVSGCSPLEVTFTNNSKKATAYDWYIDYQLETSMNNNQPFIHNFINDKQFVVYVPRITLIAGNNYTISGNQIGCVDSVFTYITVYPEVNITLVADPPEGCHPLVTDLISTSGYELTWDFGDGSAPHTSWSSLVEYEYYNYTNNSKDFNITVSASLMGCDDSASTVVTVNPSPAAIFTATPDKECSPVEVIFENQSVSQTNPTYYFWDFDYEGMTSNLENPPNLTYINTGSITNNHTIVLTVTNDFQCDSVYSQVIPVKPELILNLPEPQAGCNPFEVNFALSSNIEAQNIIWHFGDGADSIQTGGYNAKHKFYNDTAIPITYTVEVTAESASGCQTSETTEITVYPNPVANFEDPDSGCSPLKVNFINLSLKAENFLWDFGDNGAVSTEQNPDYTYSNVSESTIQHTVKLVVTNGTCKDSIFKTIEIYPELSLDLTAPTEGCNPLLNTQLELSSNIETTNIIWDFGDGSSQTGDFYPRHDFINDSNINEIFYVIVTAESIKGCRDTASIAITVFPNPIADFEPDPASGCSPLEVSFNNLSKKTTIFKWDFGDNGATSTDEFPEYTYYNYSDFPTSYTVKLNVTNGTCKDSISKTIEVYPQLELQLTANPDVGCHPLTSVLRTNPGTKNIIWDFGDGTSAQNGSYAELYEFQNNTNSPVIFNVKVFAENYYDCPSNAAIDVTVYPSPKASFSAIPAIGCSPLDVTFSNFSEKATKYLWDFGDQSPSSTEINPSHTYINDEIYESSYKVVLIAENDYEGCIDKDSVYVRVSPKFTLQLTATPAEGCNPLSTVLKTNPGGTVYKWDFGDGTTENGNLEIQRLFRNQTLNNLSYRVSVSAVNVFDCPAEAETDVTVYPVPVPTFTATPAEQQLPDSEIFITNNTEGNLWDYLWNFGDGVTSSVKNPVSHTYSDAGTYLIRLKAFSEFCSDSVSQIILIIPNLPTIDYGPPKSGCPPLLVQFYNNSTGADIFIWEFGDGMISYDKEPVYTYKIPGVYAVSLTAIGLGGELFADGVVVEVFESPTAYFEIIPKEVYVPGEQPTFINRSVGAVSYLWDFGDGSPKSEEFMPTHKYTEPGYYTITLTVKNDKGCEDMYVLPEAVKANQGGELKYPNAFTPNPAGPSGGVYNFGDPYNYVFYPFVQKGVDEYQLQIFTRWGELIFESHDINIGWDGYYRGKLSAQGVYVWRVSYKSVSGKTHVDTGDVTLLR